MARPYISPADLDPNVFHMAYPNIVTTTSATVSGVVDLNSQLADSYTLDTLSLVHEELPRMTMDELIDLLHEVRKQISIKKAEE